MPEPSRARMQRVLILGGTAEARTLAALALARYGEQLEIVTSLAGRTSAPAAIAGQVRRGGFGGVAGLSAYLAAERIAAVVDATHPFATAIHRAARLAAEQAQVPRVALVRPPWRAQPGDRWTEVADARTAAALLPRLGTRVWLTVGAKDLAAFAQVPAWFLVRRIEPGSPILPGEVVLGRGPFSLAEERALIARHAIDVLVTKASGGPATRAKLDAARAAEIPVVLIRRPPPEPGATVADEPAVLAWLAATLNLGAGNLGAGNLGAGNLGAGSRDPGERDASGSVLRGSRLKSI
jgi:precorrin-6A/cobalt-precorrin-6A reductase